MTSTSNYQDINYDYKLQGGDSLLQGSAVLSQSIENIIQSSPYSRLFNRNFGLGIEHIIGEPVSETYASVLKLLLLDNLEYYEPRIEVNYSLSVVRPLPDENAYEILVSYTILNTEQTITHETVLSQL